MNELEEKYIDLLLNRCLNFKISKSLFISYDKINKDFIDKLLIKVKKMGITDIYIEENDINVTIDKLKNLSMEEIEKDPYFDKSIWDTYAIKNANFLMIDTEFPHFMDDVDEEKFALIKSINLKTRKIFREKEEKLEIPWCIAAFPNKYWANDILGESDDSYEKLFKLICKVCLVDTDNPIESWNKYLNNLKKISDRLNELKIKKLYYKNSLGTNLELEMPDNCIWSSAASEEEKDMFVNMPSYEIFSSPNYLSTSGIVYSSKPLIYGGKTIDKFYLKFEKGKVVEYDAVVGKDTLKSILETDSNSCYLGEVALVNYDSPISNTNLVYKTTLFDENASCHLALGDSFSNSVEGASNLSSEELLKLGLNKSINHVDFMIGTSDLEIEAVTVDNKKVKIFKNGNFCDF